MVRPRKCRLVANVPKVNYFKPRGVPLRDLEESRLSVEELEALRLVEIQGLEHEQAARLMNVSRQTFGRVLAAARHSVARAVVLGQALRIEGGEYAVKEPASEDESSPPQRCCRRGEEPGPAPGWSGQGRGKEPSMGKIAVSSEGPTLDDLVDPRFGRAGGFVLVDPESMRHEYLDNGVSQARAQGAGIQAAEVVAGAGVAVVLTGYVGPKAFQALSAVGVQVVQDLGGLTVREAVAKFKAGQLKPAQGPNREGRGA